MQEFEIYLPTTHNDGSPVDPAVIDRVKQDLAKSFGGYTHLTHRNDGAWRMGGVTFHDEVTIVRVLDDGTSTFDMPQFKAMLEDTLKQETILIVCRDIEVVS